MTNLNREQYIKFRSYLPTIILIKQRKNSCRMKSKLFGQELEMLQGHIDDLTVEIERIKAKFKEALND